MLIVDEDEARGTTLFIAALVRGLNVVAGYFVRAERMLLVFVVGGVLAGGQSEIWKMRRGVR
jgi:hypothetical protein